MSTSTRCLQLPLDVESLPEFRLLCDALLRHATAARPLTRSQAEAVATRLWLRHWIELAYQAESTNQPGVLTREGAALFAASVDELFGDDVNPADLLVESRCAQVRDNGETFCARFADLNPHFAGDYKSKEDRGAVNSAIVRQQKQIERTAVQQGNLLPLVIFKRRDGTEMTEMQRNRCLVLIANLDNALGNSNGRRSTQFNEGLMADACAAVDEHEPDELKPFYFWLANNREKPLVPKLAEQILASFEKYFSVAEEQNFK